MKLARFAMALRLARGRTVSIRGGAGNVISVEEGAVWITEENSPHDVVLQAGEQVQLAGNGVAVLEAFSDASLSLATTAFPASRHH